jgi:hypothetical protein
VTQTQGETDRFARFRARNALIRTVREQLKGKGLDTRELQNDELVISCPGHPEKGRVYINLRTGEASHRRVLWDYLGYLPGYGSSDADTPRIDTDTIVTTLTGAEGIDDAE